jgi:integrase
LRRTKGGSEIVTPSTSITLREQLRLPIETVEVDGLPKILAGNLPVTPINVTLRWKQERRGATKSSLDTYCRAARLYTEFAARRAKSLIDVTNEEFRWFTHALTGGHFLDETGQQRQLSGSRGPRTADLMIALLYSLAADLQEIYQVRFDWYRYRGAPPDLVELVRALGGKVGANTFRREHRVPYTPRKIIALPDIEFERLLLAARQRWLDTIQDGDTAFAEDPDALRGALFYRNLAILLTLRLEGARRSEPPFITLEDIDREKSRIYLVTKGHGGEKGERLPVVLHPLVESAIWVYVTRYRPVTAENSVKGYPVFVSHSTRDYGRRISAQTVRKMIDALRDSLTSPWDRLVSPHTLRHGFASDLQRYGGEAAVVVNMRHASYSSLKPYGANPEVFADELSESGGTGLTKLLSEFGIETRKEDD